ncbi:MAG TPA: DUF4926 domain-containing protein [Tepidisphaeraceae bacterium]|nr:DUF4926 domain-containing protein [Tepidisphaeraceae bacterium]
MTPLPIQELDLVALICDLPSEHLTAGQVGTVVHVHTPEAFEVEFVDNDGQTYALATLRSNQLLRLQFTPAEAA